jgi:outer membrane receptor protein involved in Fe transport
MKKISVRIFVTLVFFVGLLVISPSAFAQGNADLSGITKDANGAAVPNVKVKVRNMATNLTRETASDPEGRYAFPSLPIGKYEVTGISAGFQETKIITELTVGQKTELEVILTPAGVAASVTVEATDRLALETSTSTLGQLVSKRQVENLPINGRDYTQLVLLQPGVTQARSDQGDILSGKGPKVSVHGARTTSNSYMLDGTDIIDALGRTASGANGVVSGIESVQEFTVLTNTYSAEYGRASGGVFNIATRSGTNHLHGTVFEYLRNSALDAANFFENATGSPKAPFKRNQFGFALGGPIIKNKLFIFGSYEGFRESLGITDVQSVPSLAARKGDFLPAGATINPAVVPYLALIPLPTIDPGPTGQTGTFAGQFKQPANLNTYNIRGDYSLSKRDTLFARYTQNDSTTTFFNVETFPTFPNLGTNFQKFFTVSETRVFSRDMVNSFRYAFNRTTPSESPAPVDSFTNLAFIPGEIVGDISITGFKRFGSDRNTPRSFFQNTNQFADDLSIVRGPHALKLGANIEHFDIQGDSSSRNRGEFVFQTFSDFLRANPRSFTGLIPGHDNTVRHHVQSLLGFYFQDDWKARPNLTLNLGLRYEFITVPKELNGINTNVGNPNDAGVTTGPLFKNPSLKNFSPRVGFAYSPNYKDGFVGALFGGPGKTSLRGGFGLYFDQLLYSVYGNMTFKHAPFFEQVTINQAPAPNVLPFPNVFPILSSKTFSLDTFSITATPSPTYVMQYNFNVQREFSSRVVLTAAYVGARGVHLWREADFNIANSLNPPFNTLFPAVPLNQVKRRNPNFGSIRFKVSDSNSFYNSLQLNVQTRLGRGLTGSLSYTFSKSIDDGSSSLGRNEFANGQARSEDPFNLSLSRGLSDFDVRHRLSANFSYDLPFGPGRRFLSKATGAARLLVQGWQLNGILSAESGLPVSPIFTFDQDRDGSIDNEQRPNLAPGVTGIPTNLSKTQLFDPTVFVIPAVGTRGTLGRNTIEGPGLVTFDPSITKSFPLNADGSRSIQFRTEIFNVFNHPNFAIPEVGNLTVFTSVDSAGKGVLNPTAGQITKTSTSSRQIQFSLRLVF